MRGGIALVLGSLAHGADPAGRILFIVGPTHHPPGTHEPLAGARLLEYCVERAPEGRRFQTALFKGWPSDPAAFADARLIVFTGDQFPPYVLDGSARIFAQLAHLVARGCSLVCLHYATSVNDTADRRVPPEVERALYQLLGGFGHFLPHNALPGTQARILRVVVTPALIGHPILRGVAAFTLRDEPYYPIQFDPTQSGAPVTPLATAELPPEAPTTQTVAWCLDRGNGSRTFCVVMPHFFSNWQVEPLRKLVLNGIFWAAGADIPPQGIASRLPPLETFQPAAVHYNPAILP